MKVSIWQQWASNHSGSITIVGSFESPEKAAEAAAAVVGIIKYLTEWYERPENAGLAVQGWDSPPTPIEVELIGKYGLKVDRHFDFGEDVRASISVAAVDRLAVINISEVRDEPPELLKSLLERLGSREVTSQYDAEGEPITSILVSLTCNAPDEARAAAIQHIMQQHLKGGTEMPPWGYDTIHYASVVRGGARLAFDMYFYDIEGGLPGLLRFLDSEGCKEIAYVLREIEIYGLPVQAVLKEIYGDKLLLSRESIEVNLSCLAPDVDTARRILSFIQKPDERVLNFQIGGREWLTPGAVTLDRLSFAFHDLKLSGYEVDYHLHAIIGLLISFGCKDFVVAVIDAQSGEQL